MTYSTKHFSKGGDPLFSCPCCNEGGLSISILIVLELVRMHFDAPVTITSGARCAKHNKKVGGAKNSEHKFTEEDPLVDAVDISVKGVTPTQVYMYLKNLPFANLLGLGKYKSWVHVDTRGYAARWRVMMRQQSGENYQRSQWTNNLLGINPELPSNIVASGGAL